MLNPVRDIYVQVYRSNVIANSNKLMPNDYRVRMPSMNGDICLSETVISGSKNNSRPYTIAKALIPTEIIHNKDIKIS